jgi:type II secretory pathway pseudopilin PulG
MGIASGEEMNPFRHSKAFTLVEVLIVLALTMLVFTTVSISFRSPRQQMDLEAAVARIRSLDQIARIEARRHGRARLTIDWEAGTLSVRALRPEEKLLATHSFARGVAHVDPTGNRTGGPRVVDYDGDGRSPTFGLGLGSTAPEAHRWVVVAGDSGQITSFTTRETLDAILEATTKTWIDAH